MPRASSAIDLIFLLPTPEARSAKKCLGEDGGQEGVQGRNWAPGREGGREGEIIFERWCQESRSP